VPLSGIVWLPIRFQEGPMQLALFAALSLAAAVALTN
jgi:hypothetical protein